MPLAPRLRPPRSPHLPGLHWRQLRTRPKTGPLRLHMRACRANGRRPLLSQTLRAAAPAADADQQRLGASPPLQSWGLPRRAGFTRRAELPRASQAPLRYAGCRLARRRRCHRCCCCWLLLLLLLLHLLLWAIAPMVPLVAGGRIGPCPPPCASLGCTHGNSRNAMTLKVPSKPTPPVRHPTSPATRRLMHSGEHTAAPPLPRQHAV